jgi:hypothetical protein
MAGTIRDEPPPDVTDEAEVRRTAERLGLGLPWEEAERLRTEMQDAGDALWLDAQDGHPTLRGLDWRRADWPSLAEAMEAGDLPYGVLSALSHLRDGLGGKPVWHYWYCGPGAKWDVG